MSEGITAGLQNISWSPFFINEKEMRTPGFLSYWEIITVMALSNRLE